MRISDGLSVNGSISILPAIWSNTSPLRSTWRILSGRRRIVVAQPDVGAFAASALSAQMQRRPLAHRRCQRLLADDGELVALDLLARYHRQRHCRSVDRRSAPAAQNIDSMSWVPGSRSKCRSPSQTLALRASRTWPFRRLCRRARSGTRAAASRPFDHLARGCMNAASTRLNSLTRPVVSVALRN